MRKLRELNGAWEEPGVIGIRVEIDGARLTVLWRNAPVLITAFKLKPADGGFELALDERGLRHSGEERVYAQLSRVFYRDGVLELTEDYPITGVSVTALKKTVHSRYGPYEIADEHLRELQGAWQDERGFFTLVFRGGTMTLNGQPAAVRVLRGSDGSLRVVDEDPAHYDFRGISFLDYDGACLRARLLVCDAPPVELVFHKQ